MCSFSLLLCLQTNTYVFHKNKKIFQLRTNRFYLLKSESQILYILVSPERSGWSECNQKEVFCILLGQFFVAYIFEMLCLALFGDEEENILAVKFSFIYMKSIFT